MSVVAVESCSQIYVCLLSMLLSAFSIDFIGLTHLHSQDLRHQKIRCLPQYPSRRENSRLNLIIPEEKFEHLSAVIK